MSRRIIILHQHGLELAAEGHALLNFAQKLIALFIQQLLIKRGCLHHQAQTPALKE